MLSFSPFRGSALEKYTFNTDVIRRRYISQYGQNCSILSSKTQARYLYTCACHDVYLLEMY